MGSTSLPAVSPAIFGRLNVASLTDAVSSGGAGCTGGVKDFIPQPPPFPFLFYELFERDISGLGDGQSVKQVQLRLRVFSQFLGASEAQRIMAEAIRLLQFQAPTATGWLIPKIGRPNEVIPIEFTEINGVVCRELVSIWDDLFADEVVTP